MIDLIVLQDLIPNILKHLSYEYHILFLKYLDSDDIIILNNHRSYIFCQLLLPNNLINIQYLLNLKQVISPKTKFNDFFHETKLLFLLIKNNKHHIINYIYNKYPIDYKNISFRIIEKPFIFEYLIKNNIIERKFLKNNYIKYVKYNIRNDNYDFYSKYNIPLTNIIDNFPISNEDLPLIDIFLNHSYNLMSRLNRIAYQNIIIKYYKECKYKWLKSDTFLHIKNKNEIVIEWLKSNNKIHFDLTQYIAAV